jgi:predicted nucleotidyltransferase
MRRSDSAGTGAGQIMESTEMSLLRQTYERIAGVLSRDSRIVDVELVGSLRDQTENAYSDIDLTVTVRPEKFREFYCRENLDAIFANVGALGFFLYFKPSHRCNLCTAVLDNWVFLDAVFELGKSGDDERILPVSPANADERMREAYYRYWIDSLFFLICLERESAYHLEALRGLNLIRDQHLLECIFLGSERPDLRPSYRALGRLSDHSRIEKRLSLTVPRSTAVDDIRIAFHHMHKLFDDVYLRSGREHDRRFQPVVVRSYELAGANLPD